MLQGVQAERGDGGGVGVAEDAEQKPAEAPSSAPKQATAMIATSKTVIPSLSIAPSIAPLL
jgi:hypothetical protein